MQEPGLGGRISTKEFDALAQAPGTLVHTSDLAGWNGVLVRYYAHAGDGRLKIPAVCEDALIITDCHVADVQGKVVRPFRGQRPAPGDMFIVPRGEPSEWQWAGKCHVIQLSPDPSLVTRVAVETLDVDPARVELVPRITFQDPLVYEIGRALLAELHSGGPAGRLYVDLLTQTLIVHLLRSHAAFPVEPHGVSGGLLPTVLRRVQEYVAAHLPDELRLAELATVANISPYHFARLFRQSVGNSVHSYVTERRLELAARLLAEGLTLTEVATRTGFADQSHLCRRYKARFGLSPRAHAQRRTNSQAERTKIQADKGRNH